MMETNVSNICRICVKESLFHSDIYTDRLGDGKQLFEVINDLLHLDVEFEDGYPQSICSVCYNKISDFEIFKRTAHEGRAVLLYSKGNIENNDIKLEDETADFGGFVPVQNEIYLVPVKIEDYDTVHVDRDPLEIEIKNEVEDPLHLDEGHELDLEVSSFPVHFAESEDVLDSEGMSKSRKETGIQMNNMCVDEGYKCVYKDNIYRNMAETVENDIQQEGTINLASASLLNSSPNSASLNNNVTKEVNQETNEKWTSMLVKGSTSKCNGKELGNYNIRNIERDETSMGESMKRVYTDGVVRGKSGNIDEEIEEDKIGTLRSKCRLFKCDDCGEGFSNGIDMLNHTKVHYGVHDNGCKLRDGVTVARKDENERLSGKRSFECNSCNERFYRKGDLKIHVRIHMEEEEHNFINSNASISSESIRTGEKTLKCKFCKKKFVHCGKLKNHERLHNGGKRFNCKFCPRYFHWSCHLKEHERVHTGEKPFQCKFCPKNFTRNHKLENHERLHTGEEPFQCQFCPKKFIEGFCWKRHERMHTGEKPFKCKFCPKMYAESGKLKIHERVHTGEKPFQCKLCPMKFIERGKLKRHVMVHTGEKTFECKFCPKKFIENGKLKIHERVHTGEKPFQCKFCQKKFIQRSYMKLHERTHTGEKVFQCKFCPKKFIKNSKLKIHEWMHSGEKPFQCRLCPLKFIERGSLRRHEKGHTCEKTFQCNSCPKKFISNSKLKIHERVHTGEKPFQCKFCLKNFMEKGTLKRHEMVHTSEKMFQCTFCLKKFIEKGGLKRHEKVHASEKPFQCKYCPKKFIENSKRKIHERVHTGEKPYQCKFCPKKFIGSGSLKRHEKVHTSE